MQGMNELKAHIREKLDDKRFHHSLCVQKRAEQLALLRGLNVESASIAGLLHDVCKCEPREAQLQMIRQHGIILDDFTLRQPKLWHAVAGSVYCRQVLGIDDEEILAAIRWHTTGRAGMSPFEELVYLADLTSDDRGFRGVEELRVLAETSPAECMWISLQQTLKKLVKRGRPIVADAWGAYNDYSMKMADKANAITAIIGG